MNPLQTFQYGISPTAQLSLSKIDLAEIFYNHLLKSMSQFRFLALCSFTLAFIRYVAVCLFYCHGLNLPVTLNIQHSEDPVYKLMIYRVRFGFHFTISEGLHDMKKKYYTCRILQ